MKNGIKFLATMLVVLLFASCSSIKDVRYFQDAENGKTSSISNTLLIKVRPEDKLSIVVNSKDPELAALVNLPVQSARIGANGSVSGSTQSVSVYTVDPNGDIDFPVIGKIRVAGKTRSEIAETVKNELVNSSIIKDPIVTVEFSDMYISMLGEVNKPGRYLINQDKVTILDAMGMAGDLTIYGRRDSVQVLRKVDEGQIAYVVNLTNFDTLLQSPAYYLQQNDVVYVQPNDTRARQSTLNGNNVRSTSFWISLGSFVVTALNFVIVVLNRK